MKLTLCPLDGNRMTLTDEVMQRLGVAPGSRVFIVKHEGLYFLCGPAAMRKYLEGDGMELRLPVFLKQKSG